MRDCERSSCRCDGIWNCSCLQSWLFTLSWVAVACSFVWIAWSFSHPADRTDIIIHRYEVSDVPPCPPECDGTCGKDCKCKGICGCEKLASEEPCEDESPCSCNKSCVCGCQTHGCCGCPREKDIEIIIVTPEEKGDYCPPEEHGQALPEPVKKPKDAWKVAPPKKPKQADECPKG